MAQPPKHPGVYLSEEDAFPRSIVEVATAVPAFIGYTETASFNGKSLVNIPTRITSFAEYLMHYGGRFSPVFHLLDPQEVDRSKMTIGEAKKSIKYADVNHLLFYDRIKLFYANGGGICYIVAVDTYGGKPGQHTGYFR